MRWRGAPVAECLLLRGEEVLGIDPGCSISCFPRSMLERGLWPLHLAAWQRGGGLLEWLCHSAAALWEKINKPCDSNTARGAEAMEGRPVV